MCGFFSFNELMKMVVFTLLKIIKSLEQIFNRSSGGFALLNCERNALKVEGLVNENGYCARHGHTKAGKKSFGFFLCFVVYSKIYLCHNIEPFVWRKLYQNCIYKVNCMLYNIKTL